MCPNCISVTVMAVLCLSENKIASNFLSDQILSDECIRNEICRNTFPDGVQGESSSQTVHRRFLVICSTTTFFQKMQKISGETYKNQNKDSTNSESLSDQTLSDANCCTDSRVFSNLTSNSLIFQFLCAALKHFFKNFLIIYIHLEI